jgi:anionic cell wall polymer biosynthesis LytR-Cps2A-Psr (LCP) family protein
LIESKGEHLLGNNDTNYKNEVFKKMTEQNKSKKIKTYQIEIEFDMLNAPVEAYLIEDQKEEQQIKELMK